MILVCLKYIYIIVIYVINNFAWYYFKSLYSISVGVNIYIFKYIESITFPYAYSTEYIVKFTFGYI